MLDEPLSNLDARLRLQTREEIRKIQQATQITTLFVTHDQDEAMSISDLIVVMREGSIQQIGKPQEVYDNPANLFVAKFLGTPPINVFEGEIREEALVIGADTVLKTPGIENQKVWAAIRPEGFLPDKNGPFRCQLNRVEVMGRDVSILSAHAGSENAVIRSIISAEQMIDPNAETVAFSLKPNKVLLFRRDNEKRIHLGGNPS